MSSQKSQIDAIVQNHKKIFKCEPELISYAPGRINLIGEHTDYNNGFVLPAAIDMGVWIGISKEQKDVISVYSIDFKELKTASLHEKDYEKKEGYWFNYPFGVVKVLQENGYKFQGINLTFTGNVPQGSGLSSSAALEISTGFAIQQLYSLKIDGPSLAKIGQKAEHNYVGVKCGIMDQFISRMGKANNALLIDCKTLEFKLVPLDLKAAKLIITNSNVPHKLSASQYNQRVSECSKAVEILSTSKKGTSLRDYTMEDFKLMEKKMPDIIRKRAFHVISENNRVLKTEIALKKGDLKEFGKLMNESHQSLRDNYEVSSKELDWLTEVARSVPGCYGSRMTGAGFGGCTITLIESKSIDSYKQKLNEYEKIFGYKPVVYESGVADGVHLVSK
jgi:galactokinase